MVRIRFHISDIRKYYYQEGLSVLETATKLGKTSRQLFRFMRKHNLPRRTFSQTMRIKFYRSPLSYNKKGNLTTHELKLWQAALMLYWAEGYKATPTIDFANSDPKMVAIFLKCLREIYQVSEARIRILLYCYSNQNVIGLIRFWSSLLKLPISQFSKPFIRYDFSLQKANKMAHGLVHIRYSDRRLFEQIMAEVDKIGSELCRDGRVDNYTTL